MEDGWFYVEGEVRRGPVSVDALHAALRALPDQRRVLVWREGMTDWAEAGAVPELARRLPPHMPDPVRVTPPTFPPAPPQFPPPDAAQIHAIEAVARSYRLLVGLVGGQLLFSLVMRFATAGLGPELAALAGLFTLAVALGLTIASAVTAYRLAAGIDAGPPVLWAVIMFVPCFNLLGLLVISSKAQAWCKSHGIAVGFLGPTQAGLDSLRRGSR
jgi:hypothetical protein